MIGVYIGAGLDLRPIELFQNIRHFIYIDSLPASENPLVDPYDFDPFFLRKLLNKMEMFGFEWTSRDLNISCCGLKNPQKKPFHIKFRRYLHTVDYYFSTIFPLDIDNNCLNQISQANTLIVSGYMPDLTIIQMMKNPIHLICFHNDNKYDETVLKNFEKITHVSSKENQKFESS